MFRKLWKKLFRKRHTYQFDLPQGTYIVRVPAHSVDSIYDYVDAINKLNEQVDTSQMRGGLHSVNNSIFHYRWVGFVEDKNNK